MTIRDHGHDHCHWLKRQVAGCLVLLLIAPFVAAAPSPQPPPNSSQQTEAASSPEASLANSDSGVKKVTTEASEPQTFPNSPGSVRSETVADNRQSSGQQPSPMTEQYATQEPVGTAAAQPVKTTGVAASEPAGAAIAPARQRRARSILIKVAAIVGAGVAVGTVVALSSGSPSRPH
jgi:hypothetical protein